MLAVVSTIDAAAGKPESALVAYVEDDNLCLYFQTGKHTRKASNLKANHHVSFVVGLVFSELQTLQYDGVAELLEDVSAIEACKQRFLDKKSPTTKEYLERPDAIFFKVTPSWMRFSDYTKGNHPPVLEITEF